MDTGKERAPRLFSVMLNCGTGSPAAFKYPEECAFDLACVSKRPDFRGYVLTYRCLSSRRPQKVMDFSIFRTLTSLGSNQGILLQYSVTNSL